jgi:hypothetical protein
MMKDADIKAHILALFDEDETKTRILRLAARGIFAAKWWRFDQSGEVEEVAIQSIGDLRIGDLREQTEGYPLTFLKHPHGLVAPCSAAMLWEELRREARDLILEDRADALAITFDALLGIIGGGIDLGGLGEDLTIPRLLEIAGGIGEKVGSNAEAPTAYQLINVV